jgi:CRP/FNR family transcriptional regulator, anaerobic regulatory protein
MHTAETSLHQHTVNLVRPSVSTSTYIRTTEPADGEKRCSSCALKGKCFPGMADAELSGLDSLKFARRRIKEGEALYSAGQKFAFVYAVRSGTMKTAVPTGDGREQVSGFVMAGEIIGLDALATGVHATGAWALEDVEVCAIPFAHLMELGATQPRMHLALSRMMSSEIVRDRRLALVLGSMSAVERVATFLLDVSDRMKVRGYSATEFHLRMWRADIGSYLGMTLETVSRTLSAFQRQQLLAVDKKHIRILDIDSLRAIAGQTLH